MQMMENIHKALGRSIPQQLKDEKEKINKLKTQ